MEQYLPVLALIVLGVIFGVLSLLASRLLAPRRESLAKSAPYECGIIPSREPPERFPVRFYMVAMLFIMFDIEIVFLYPYAVLNRELGAFGFFAIVIFSLIFFLSFVYEVAKGGLEWGPLHRAHRQAPARSSERTTETTIKRVGLEGREGPEGAAA